MNRLTALDWLLIAAAVVFLIVIILVFVAFASEFSRELKYLKNEIERTSGSEREYWKKRRRRLWLSVLPFVRY